MYCTRPLSIVVPVYGALAAVKLCLASLQKYVGEFARVVVIDDASPEASVGSYLQQLSADWSTLEVLQNPRNLGFVGTVNRGFEATAGDVVLLNSDTYVTAGWLEALQDCVAHDLRIATATPFSNNATICSWPDPCADNLAPALGIEADQVAAAVHRMAWPLYPELPTAVGFCMYIRRAALRCCGGFDLAFSPGYGEENDFSRRVAKAGFRNVLCDSAYVVHAGGKSFQEETSNLKKAHAQLLAERYPEYDQMVADFIAADCLRAQRQAISSQLVLLKRDRPATLWINQELLPAEQVIEGGAIVADYHLLRSPQHWQWHDLAARVTYRFTADWIKLDQALLDQLCHIFRVGQIIDVQKPVGYLTSTVFTDSEFAKMSLSMPLSRTEKHLLLAALDPRWNSLSNHCG